MNPDPLAQAVRVGLLRDLYGALLTPGQQRVLELAFDRDLSLTEAAELLGVSRQAVHDQIRRAISQMEGYEQALGLLAREERQEARLRAAREAWSALRRELERLDLPEPERRRLLALWRAGAEALRDLERGEGAEAAGEEAPPHLTGEPPIG